MVDEGGLALFSPAVREWFAATFPEPTPAQRQGWPAIASGDHTLILAPTGSGKTLAAFLWALDRLITSPSPEQRSQRTRVLYLSPLRALAVDVEKNLRSPLLGIALAAERLGLVAPGLEREVATAAQMPPAFHVPTVGTRTGDTAADERRKLIRTPPDILITTPESLYLMLTSAARETLTNIDTVIVDEIHALTPTKRGAHLALSLERLEAIAERPPQRIGLSATQRPLEVIARFLGGFDMKPDGTRTPRPVTVIDAGIKKPLEVEVVVPIEDMGELGSHAEAPASGSVSPGPVRKSIWPSIHPHLLDLVDRHRSTLIFVNNRRLAERLATRLNELWLDGENRAGEGEGRAAAPGTELVRAHHGSLSRERRVEIEDELKRGALKGLVATSSLELGIDMGAVDLVVQVESPGAVSRGLQRIGRAGHQVGEPSRGKLFPKHRADLLEAAVVVKRMREGLIESTRYPRNPVDVLAQQIVAMCALDDWPVEELTRVVRGAANFTDLSDDVMGNVLDLLAGRYPSEEFSELRPRIVWDRVDDVVRGRKGAQRLAVTSGGTIPDRGLFGVFLPDGRRVGELDEEMVYESRPGETFLLGASTWRIEEITHDRVIVTPAPGQPGRMPFWHGDGPGRPLELGRALGAFVRDIRSKPPELAYDELRGEYALDEWAARNLLLYLDEQAEASAGAVPDDRTIVVERFRDEIGDWRVCVLTPFGAQVHAPWAMAIRNRLGERWGVEVEAIWSDDGIVLRLPDAFDDGFDFLTDDEEAPPEGSTAHRGESRSQFSGTAHTYADLLGADFAPAFLEELLIDPDEIDELVIATLPNTALFTTRFREAAGRALLLPRRRPDRRTPLWQQRQKAADLLRVAARFPDFPLLLEATRECMNDVFDLPALREVLTDLKSRKIRAVPVQTQKASPFAQSLLFGWVAVHMYDYDSPLAERRAAALALDRDLLRELLGAEELRDLVDPGALADLELELQCLADGHRARDVDEVHDLLRRLGPMTMLEIDSRCNRDGVEVRHFVEELERDRRAIRVLLAGEEKIASADDAGRLRDALGVAIPTGLPTVYTEPVATALTDLASRYARTHGPFLTHQLVAWLGVPAERVIGILEGFESDGTVVRGEFRPDGVDREWCDADVLRRLRRRSLSALRKEVEPVSGDALARFLPGWQGVGIPRRGLDGLVEAIGSLQGAALPVSVLERDVLPARVVDYRPADLDALCTGGEVVWVGAGGMGSTDGRVRLLFRDQAALLMSTPQGDDRSGATEPIHDALRTCMSARGAVFWADLVSAAHDAGLPYDYTTVLEALWDLVWSGEVTNDTLTPARARVSGKGRRGGMGSVGAVSSPRGRRPDLGRRRLDELSRLGPPAGTGRWSLVAPLLDPPVSPTERAHSLALQLLERHGVVTREAVNAEGVQGGFAGIYPVLKALEESGQVRRGYFVTGLGAAQFALPGAVDRVRSCRDPAKSDLRPVVLAAADPAQPYGAALAWPVSAGRPARAGGAHVVLVEGHPTAYLDKGGHSLVLFETATDHPQWAEGLASLVLRGRRRKIEITKIDGAPAIDSPFADDLRAAGFRDGYRGLVLGR